MTAPNARTALQVTGRVRFDTLVVDLKLPDMNGIDLIKAIRANGVGAPAILYTAYPESRSAIEATRMGVEYISKLEVAKPRDLARIIRKAIQADRAKKEDPIVVLLESLAAKVATTGVPVAAWRASATAQLIATMSDSTTTFASFMSAAEALLQLQKLDASSAGMSGFIRLHVARSRHRCAVARAVGVETLVQAVESAGPGWRDLTGETAIGGLLNAESTRTLRHVGWSVDYLVKSAVLRRAILLIAHTDERLSEIGYQLGFEHPTAFDRLFRSLINLAPREVRRLARPQH